MIEPTDWGATPMGTIPAAPAAPDPLGEPPGECAALWGLVVGPAFAIAYSVVTVVPTMTAPASRKRRTTVESDEGTRLPWIGVPQMHRMPATSTVSFTAAGMPCKSPQGFDR